MMSNITVNLLIFTHILIIIRGLCWSLCQYSHKCSHNDQPALYWEDEDWLSLNIGGDDLLPFGWDEHQHGQINCECVRGNCDEDCFSRLIVIYEDEMNSQTRARSS